MTSESGTPDALIDWFHELADGVRAETRSPDSTARDHLSRFLAAFLPGHQLSGTESESELKQLVLDLRENEREWNRSLGLVILRANDASSTGAPREALEMLEDFAHKCPWLYLSEVAADQASHYDAGGSV